MQDTLKALEYYKRRELEAMEKEAAAMRRPWELSAGWAALARVPNGSVSCLTVTAH